MKNYLLLIVLFSFTALRAEETASVQQFTLADGRVLQAVRLIKISAKLKTTYMITLVDGRKLSFDADDVVKIEETRIAAALVPAPPIVEKKAEPVAAPPPRIVVLEPEFDPYSRPAPELYVESYRPRRYYRYRDNNDDYSPPPPVVNPPPQPEVRRPLTASETARRAFTTIGSSPVQRK